MSYAAEVITLVQPHPSCALAQDVAYYRLLLQ
jgi:hypothetical protein